MSPIDLMLGMALVVLAGIYGIYWAEARRKRKDDGGSSPDGARQEPSRVGGFTSSAR